MKFVSSWILALNILITTISYIQAPKEVDGVYQLLLCKVLPLNSKAAGVQEGAKFDGQLILKKGYFSLSQVTIGRNDDWISTFPKDYSELGYKSMYGTFRVDANEIVLTTKSDLHPMGNGQTLKFSFESTKTELKLSRRLRPNVESTLDGIESCEFVKLD